MRLLCYYFFNASYPLLFLSSIESFFAQSLIFALIFPSPSVLLGMMLDAWTYVETLASACSPRGLVRVCTELHHIGGKTQ